MRNRRRLLLISALPLLVCGGALGVVWQTRARSGAPGVAAEESATRDLPLAAAEKATTAVAVSRRGWAVGSRYDYDLSLQLTFEQSGEGEAPQPGGAQSFQIGGRFTTTVVREADGLSDLKVALDPTTLAFGQLDAAKVAELRAELSQPFVIRYDARGTAREIYFSGKGSGLVRGLLRELAATYQLTTSDPPQVEWVASELDPTGECKVAYGRLRDGRYSRRKLGYQRIATEKGLLDADKVPVVPKIDLASGLYTLDEAGRISDVASRAAVTANPQGLSMIFRSGILTTLKLVRSYHDPALAQSDPLRGLSRSALHVDSNAFADAQTKSLRQIVGNATAPELLQRMKTARAKNEPMAVGDAQHKMEALLQLEPQRIPEVVREVRAGRGDPSALDAVAGVGTPAAQQELLALAADKAAPVELRETALEAMHSVQEPTEQALVGLDAMRTSGDKDVKGGASLAFGTLAGRLAERDPEGARGHLEKLNADYDAAATDLERIQVLEIVGNAARPEVLAPIEKALASKNDELRKAGARALRLVEDPAADRLLAAVMVSDPSIDAREGAFFAASFRRFEPLAQAITTIVRTEKDAKVRGAALGLLATYFDRDGATGAGQLLGWLAANDPDQLIRENAQRALTRKGRA
jgi:hypothetical protein